MNEIAVGLNARDLTPMQLLDTLDAAQGPVSRIWVRDMPEMRHIGLSKDLRIGESESLSAIQYLASILDRAYSFGISALRIDTRNPIVTANHLEFMCRTAEVAGITVAIGWASGLSNSQRAQLNYTESARQLYYELVAQGAQRKCGLVTATKAALPHQELREMLQGRMAATLNPRGIEQERATSQWRGPLYIEANLQIGDASGPAISKNGSSIIVRQDKLQMVLESFIHAGVVHLSLPPATISSSVFWEKCGDLIRDQESVQWSVTIQFGREREPHTSRIGNSAKSPRAQLAQGKKGQCRSLFPHIQHTNSGARLVMQAQSQYFRFGGA